jgi:ABC-type uncharacterized transport system substrate-binding protein
MMKKRSMISLWVMLMVGLIFSFNAMAADKGEFSISPKKNDGKKWRIGYYQGGDYVDYQTILKALIRSLADIGWVEPVELPPSNNPKETKELWQWISINVRSRYIIFVPEAYYNADWKPDRRKKNRQAAIAQLKSDTLDLMLAFGTWAGQDLANDEQTTPVEVLSTSDPLGSSIVKSLHDSGHDHVHAKLEPRRYQQQIELFHDIIGFKKLGVVYEDTVEGRTYAAVDKIESVALDRGFDIVPCIARFSGVSESEAFENVLSCHQQIASRIDALYITVHRGVYISGLGKLLAPIYHYNIPTFSQSGSKEVKFGVLFSIAQAGFAKAAMFHAKAIAKTFNGAKPRELDMIFESPLKIAINLAVAQQIGYDPPIEVLGAADEIFLKIERKK